MNIALICTNVVSINNQTQKGTEIFDRILIPRLAKHMPDSNLVAFAAADSDLPIPIEAVGMQASIKDETMPQEKYIIFELALLSKAFLQQEKFDLFHINIGDGDIALPFAPFVKKPIIITIHHIFTKPYATYYFSLFKHLPNIYFISASNAQRKSLPDLNYFKTIYHGIEEDHFVFDPNGGDTMMWAGRGIPDKGLDDALQVSYKTRKSLSASIVKKAQYSDWLDELVGSIPSSGLGGDIISEFNVKRDALIAKYQASKIFLFPTKLEEVFGLVLVEAMACGTPIVGYARGAVPEIVVDGVTGFLVNPSDDDIRGDYIIKKTGIDGLAEAVEKVYSLSEIEYKKMRQLCRERVEGHFTADRMAKEYVQMYKEIYSQNQAA